MATCVRGAARLVRNKHTQTPKAEDLDGSLREGLHETNKLRLIRNQQIWAQRTRKKQNRNMDDVVQSVRRIEFDQI